MNRAVTSPAIPALAHLAERGAWAEFERLRNVRAYWATTIAAGSMLLLLVIGRPVLSLFFANSSFRPDQVEQAWRLLLVLSGVWVAGAASQVLAGAFYAQGDTETPTRIGVVSFTAGIGLKVLGFYLFGIWGIAAGASIHYVLMGTLLVLVSRRPVRAVSSQELPEPLIGSSDPAYEGDFDLPAMPTDRLRSR
jgi:putative peptidoglycan lipid II flippase